MYIGNSFDDIQIQVPSLELLLMYKTIQVPGCVLNKIKSKERLFYVKQYLEILHEIQKTSEKQ